MQKLFLMQNYVHTKSEQTSENGELEGPGYYGNYALVRKSCTVGVKRQWLSPRGSACQALVEEGGNFFSVNRGHQMWGHAKREG